MQDTMDETAVWNRVTAASRSSGGDKPATGPIGPELLAAIEQGQGTAREYRLLAGRCAGETQRTLRGLLRQAQGQVRTLSALYFFLTGQPSALGQSAAVRPRRESLSESIRRMMQQEELSAGRLEALAARSAGEVREALAAQSVAARRRFGILLALLGQNLEG